ncbi:MAG: malate synthase G, partial [Rhizobiaceae bacterium]
MTTERVETGGLKIARELHDFIVEEAMPGTGIGTSDFFNAFGRIVSELAPKNIELLQKRADLQRQISDWHKENPGPIGNMVSYESFLRTIGYLVPEGGDFSVGTQNVDPEIGEIAGPQLVVPVLNARYALNAANARWGSLYDALYGTDAISEEGGADKGPGYNETRGNKVIAWGRKFLDESTPLAIGSWADVTGFSVENGALVVSLSDDNTARLADNAQFAGYKGTEAGLDNILLVKNGLHADITINRQSPVGETDQAGIADIVLESALTSIMDNEDSIAAVDAEDKTEAYRNWLGLMKGDLEESFEKGGKTMTRRLNVPRDYLDPQGEEISLKGQVLMLTRNVGHLMT